MVVGRWSSPLSFSLMFSFFLEDFFFFFYHFIYFVLILMLSWKTDLDLDIKKLGRFLHELYFRSSGVVSQMQFAERLVLFRKRCGSGPGKINQGGNPQLVRVVMGEHKYSIWNFIQPDLVAQIMTGVLGPIPAMKRSYLSYNNSDMRIISERLSDHWEVMTLTS